VEKAIAGQPATLKRITLKTGNDKPSRPRGIAITPDGKYAAITGVKLPRFRGHPNICVSGVPDATKTR
jgi:hypothetical protein